MQTAAWVEPDFQILFLANLVEGLCGEWQGLVPLAYLYFYHQRSGHCTNGMAVMKIFRLLLRLEHLGSLAGLDIYQGRQIAPPTPRCLNSVRAGFFCFVPHQETESQNQKCKVSLYFPVFATFWALWVKWYLLSATIREVFSLDSVTPVVSMLTLGLRELLVLGTMGTPISYGVKIPPCPKFCI